MKKRMIVLSMALLCLCLMLAACSKDSPAEGPQAVAEAMFNAPNERLCSTDSTLAIGLGVETTPEQREKAEEAYQQMIDNWESDLGKYFAPNCLEPALKDNILTQHLGQYTESGQKSEVTSIELDDKDDSYQALTVHYTLDGEEKEAQVKFSLDQDGLIDRKSVV